MTGVGSTVVSEDARILEERFLGAFNEIDQYLRKDSPYSKSFGELLEEAGKTNPVVRGHFDVLKQIARLRNALVHWRTHNRLIAVPHRDKYSQFPVYGDRAEFQGLLTEGSIARWLASQSSQGLALIETTTVGEVLRTGGSGRWHFVSRKAAVAEVLELFKVPAAEPLHAVLVTERGRQDEQPLAIVTAWDLFSEQASYSTSVPNRGHGPWI